MKYRLRHEFAVQRDSKRGDSGRVVGYSAATVMLLFMSILTRADVFPQNSGTPTPATISDFGPSNPFYTPSTLPFKAPPFDKIRDEDFQPAIETGMAQQETEIESIANNPEAATLDNTIVAIEKSGQLLDRVMAAFNGVYRRPRQDVRIWRGAPPNTKANAEVPRA
jgi:hypothetical protein